MSDSDSESEMGTVGELRGLSLTSSLRSLEISEDASMPSASANRLGSPVKGMAAEGTSAAPMSGVAGGARSRRTASHIPVRTTPADFMFGSTLGEGSFARVVHARLKRNGAEFAVKIMEKRHITKQEKVKYVLMEKDVLSKMAHPRIVRLSYTFHDHHYLYMVMELAHCGELLRVINDLREDACDDDREMEACSPELTQFYTAELVDALEHLHEKGVVHRDLKPENVLVDRKGHLKLTDFGTALKVESEGRHNSFVGTAEYVSPEVLRNERATMAVDLWALGCLVFQMLTGVPVFQSDSEYLCFSRILSHCEGTEPIEYPAAYPAPARDFTEALLRENPRHRLGAGSYFNHLSAAKIASWERERVEAESQRQAFERDAEGSNAVRASEAEAAIASVAAAKDERKAAAVEPPPPPNDYGSMRRHAFWAGLDWAAMDAGRVPPPYKPKAKAFPPMSEMMDGALDDWQLDGEATPIQLQQLKPGAAPLNFPPPQEDVSDPKWSPFLKAGERIVFGGFVWKRKGLFSKHRFLILAEAARASPRLVYVDPETMTEKGVVPWTDDDPVQMERVDNSYFNVIAQSTGRSYHFKDGTAGSEVWIDHIEDALRRQRMRLGLIQA